MKTINGIVFFCISFFIISCHDKPTVYQNKIAQDINYRLGKWYSVTDSGTTSQTHNTNLDTIWFINDTLAGWTGFVPYQPHTYVFRKTYFDKTYYNIIYLAQDISDSTRVDTVKHQCGMNASQDTFTIYWDFWANPPQTESYVKMK